MEHLIYIILSTCLLACGVAWPTDTIREGCSYNENRELCRYQVICNKIIDITFQNNFERLCGGDDNVNKNVYYNGHSFSRIYLKMNNYNAYYSGPLDVHELLLHESSSANIVFSLDLSNNLYTLTPVFTTMSNLRYLNLSRNAFTEAKLTNEYELDELIEIDFSYNAINSITVNGNEIPYRKLRKINLSNNYIVSIQDAIFASCAELEELDLSYNFIDALNILSFEGIRNLQNLNLKHNRLSSLGSSLLRFGKLIYLDLSENSIQSVTFADFEKLYHLKTLYLSSNAIESIEAFAFHKALQLETIDLNNNLLEHIDKDIFTNATGLKTVDLSKNHLKFLPRGLFRDKQIVEFSVTQNTLEGSLVKGMFEGLHLITVFDLSNQKLTSVEDYAFFGLESLTLLELNNNFLRLLSRDSFKSLRNLETLDLSNNQLTEISFDKSELISLHTLLLQNNFLTQISDEYFNGLNTLQFLELSHNNISQLESNSFMSLRDLINFQISSNPLTGVLEKGSFDGLNSLPSLDISNTLLTSVKNGSFSGMSKLNVLNMSHSEISELQYNSFLCTGSIEIIDLSFNKLRDFNVNKSELIALNVLILNNNLLFSISSNFNKGLPRLTKIIVSHNLIEEIADDAFVEQEDIRYLDLSFNTYLKLNVSQLDDAKNLISLSLSGIRTNISFTLLKESHLSKLEMTHSNIYNITHLKLKHLSNLEDLYLSNNNVTQVESTAFLGINNLRKLDLSCNRITLIQPGAFKENTLLITLNISHNFLMAVSYGVFQGLIYLDTIDLSFNEISDLQSERFYEVSNLNVLIADHNKINNVNVDEFAGTNLRTLSIGGNPIPCEMLVNFKKNSPFELTAISLKNNDDENVNGVTCNYGRNTKEKHNSVNAVEKDDVLISIRDILNNMASLKYDTTSVVATNYSDYLININYQIGKLISNANISNSILEKQLSSTQQLLTAFTQGNTNTNTLLNKLMKVLSDKNTSNKIDYVPISKQNVTSENLLPYINKIKLDLEETIAEEKQKILEEIEKKILSLQSNENVKNVSFSVATHEAYSSNENSESKSFIFLEICMGLILVILIAYVLYKVHDSGVFIPSRRSTSTRNLPDSIDNSTL